MKKQLFAIFVALICSLVIFNAHARNDSVFPRPQAIEHDVQFWKRVYTEVSTNEGFIHDDKDLDIVYEKIRLPDNASSRTRHNYVKRIKRKYKNILFKLASGKRSGLSSDEQRVLEMFPKGVSNRSLRQATKRIRFQLGQSNKFRAGLIRSGKWKPFILENLDKMGLPKEIASLPHVESSFNHRAYSKVGAAGIWQFTRSTGRRFMRIDHIVDERMDPFKSSVAAARLLENNYAVTGAWPLAITAYNHGAAGMRRAAQKLGTKDIVTILRNYKSRTFGFASRNFYVAFLAALEIDADPEKYFGKLDYEDPADYEFYRLPGYMTADSVMKSLNLSRAQFIESNPELRPSVLNGNKYIPKGYEVRIDKTNYSDPDKVKSYLAALDNAQTFGKQKPDLYHRVGRGQTLSTIAARYGIRVSDIVASNNLRSRHRIRVGQVLRLPQKGGSDPKPVIVAKEDRSPKVEPTALPESGSYRVRRGDNVELIARRYGMTVNELLAINNIRNKNRIYPGQRLVLTKSEAESYTVRRGDSLNTIAKRFGMSTGDILALNNLNNKNRIYPGQQLLLTSTKSSANTITDMESYTVRRGDSIDTIAKKFGVSTSEILELNNIRNKHRIYPGQKLLLAKAETTKLELPKTIEAFPTDNETENDATATDAVVTDSAGAQEETPGDEAETSAAIGASETQQEEQSSSDAAESTQSAENEESIDSQAAEDTDLAVLGLAANDGVSEAPTPEMLAKLNENSALDNVNDDEQNNSLGNSDADVSIGVSAIKESESDTEILADPIDYSVDKNKTIVVQAAETLGHYAEWLQLRASQLRRVNRMRYGKPVVIGKKIKLDFSNVSPEEFEEQRTSYHRALQEEFFEQYQINGSEKHKIRRGESVWVLAKRKYNIPIWLLRQYNPDLDLNLVKSGTVITFPKVVNRSKEEKAAKLRLKQQEQQLLADTSHEK